MYLFLDHYRHIFDLVRKYSLSLLLSRFTGIFDIDGKNAFPLRSWSYSSWPDWSNRLTNVLRVVVSCPSYSTRHFHRFTCCQINLMTCPAQWNLCIRFSAITFSAQLYCRITSLWMCSHYDISSTRTHIHTHEDIFRWGLAEKFTWWHHI